MERVEAFMALLRAPHLAGMDEVLSADCPIPEQDGIYGVYINDVIPGLDTSRCLRVDGRPIVYVGVGRTRPTSKPNRHVRARIRDHYTNTADGSTLRMSLGCLLGIEMSYIPPKDPKGKECWLFANGGERRLDDWMRQHTSVTWLPVERPWEVERMILAHPEAHFPLNIDKHMGPNCHAARARAAARKVASQFDPVTGIRGR